MATLQTRATLHSTGAETLTDVYSCPTGARAVINNISLTNVSGSAITVDVFINDGTDDIAILDDKSLAVDETFDLDGVKILAAGDDLKVTTSATGLDMWVSIVQVT